MLEFRTFEIVSAIFHTGSLNAAAERLVMTQPALTKALSAIETDIGTKLFHRSATGMQPTGSADVFLRRWDAIQRELRDMRREIDRIHDLDEGLLRIATGYLASSSAEMAIGALKQKFPSLLIEARQAVWSDVAALVRRGEVDIGVSDPTDAEGDAALNVEFLSENDAYFICRGGHPLLSYRAPTLDDILSYPLALNLIPDRMAKYLPDDLEMRGFRRTVRGHFLPPIAVQSISAIRNILIASDAVSIMPKQNFVGLFRSGQLARIESFRPPWLSVRLGFITRAQAIRTPAMDAFIQKVRKIERGEIGSYNGE